MNRKKAERIQGTIIFCRFVREPTKGKIAWAENTFFSSFCQRGWRVSRQGGGNHPRRKLEREVFLELVGADQAQWWLWMGSQCAAQQGQEDVSGVVIGKGSACQLWEKLFFLGRCGAAPALAGVETRALGLRWWKNWQGCLWISRGWEDHDLK